MAPAAASATATTMAGGRTLLGRTGVTALRWSRASKGLHLVSRRPSTQSFSALATSCCPGAASTTAATKASAEGGGFDLHSSQLSTAAAASPGASPSELRERVRDFVTSRIIPLEVCNQAVRTTLTLDEQVLAKARQPLSAFDSSLAAKGSSSLGRRQRRLANSPQATVLAKSYDGPDRWSVPPEVR
eukprot:5287834-Pleurochrysis_carterae.AAC.2